MATITPTLTIAANASGTTSPGPISTPISISATGALTVDVVTAATLVVTLTPSTLFDGSAQDDGGTAGLHGGFVYLKNTSAADHDVYVGAVADGTSASTLDDANDAVRLFTLKQGEFAFFPYDYTMDLVVDSEHATAATLEYFLFNRG